MDPTGQGSGLSLLADENVEARLIEALRRAGHDVRSVAEVQPSADDEAVLRLAEEEGRLLITNDKDFAELAFLRRRAYAGIVLLRLSRLSTERKAERTAEVLRSVGHRLTGAMTVIEVHATRRRALLDVP